MKRFHVHVAVDDLAANIRFYSTVFGMPPTVEKPDYDAELNVLRQQVADAEIAAFDQAQAQCCYAKSDKYWITDPQGIAWETYHTLAQAGIFGADTGRSAPEPAEAGPAAAQACCAPALQTVALPMPKKKSSCC